MVQFCTVIIKCIIYSANLGSGQPSKITLHVKAIVQQQMLRDDETTAYHIHRLLQEKRFDVSIWTIFAAAKN